MKNKHIDTFNTIYDVDVIIANEAVTIDDIREKLVYSDGVQIEDNTFEAVTCTCKYKDTGRFAILVWYGTHPKIKGENKTLRRINTAAHEALHVAIDLQDFSNEKIDTSKSNEYLAYMVGYFTERIYATWTKK